MKTMRLLVLASCGTVLVTPVIAQGVAPGRRVGQSANSAPRMMIANPYTPSSTDSAAAVEIGSAVRQGVQEMVGDDYTIVTQDDMNEALNGSGYDSNAILNNSQALSFAKHLQARVAIISTLTKNQSGEYTLTTRLAGVNDEAGNVNSVTQQPGERLPDFGYRIVEELRPAVKSLADAKACIDQLETKPEKAVKAAEKAIKKVPNHGLAHYCLYQLARQQKQPPQEAVKPLEAAAKGDPLSVPVWNALRATYLAANDTTQAVAAIRQLLRLVPTDQELREGLFQYLLKSGRPKEALEVVEEGLRVDSANVELQNLKATACIVLSDLNCATQALEQIYAIDSTKVDTLYFTKWGIVTAGGQTVDTARFLSWAQVGARKFPDNITIMRNLYRAYLLTGQVDSSVAVTQRLIARDTTAVVPALAAVQVLVQAKRVSEIAPYVDFIKRYGNQKQKDQLAQMLVVVALSRYQGDSAAGQAPDLTGAIELAHSAIEIADSTGEPFQYANFVLGAAFFQQGDKLDDETEREKSCEKARQEQQLMADAKDALSKVQIERYKALTTQYLGYIDKYGPRITAMLKSYCR